MPDKIRIATNKKKISGRLNSHAAGKIEKN
jgi:hypothetical protein